MTTATVSIVVSSSRGNAHLGRCLNSIVRQHAIENVSSVVVCDSGSSSIASVIEEFSVLPITHLKVQRFQALDQVVTPWVAFIDDEDEWHPAHLSLALQQLQNLRNAVLYVSSALWKPDVPSELPDLCCRCPQSVVLEALMKPDETGLLPSRWLLLLNWMMPLLRWSSVVIDAEALKETVASFTAKGQSDTLESCALTATALKTDQSWVYGTLPTASVASLIKETPNSTSSALREVLCDLAQSQNVDLIAEWKALFSSTSEAQAQQIKAWSLDWLGRAFHSQASWEAMGVSETASLESKEGYVRDLLVMLDRLRTEALGWRGHGERKCRALRTLQVEMKEFKDQARKTSKELEKKVGKLEKQLESAKAWQQRSWVKRAFHRWSCPNG